jgi:hypothetical protein
MEYPGPRAEWIRPDCRNFGGWITGKRLRIVEVPLNQRRNVNKREPRPDRRRVFLLEIELCNQKLTPAKV